MRRCLSSDRAAVFQKTENLHGACGVKGLWRSQTVHQPRTVYLEFKQVGERSLGQRETSTQIVLQEGGFFDLS